MAREQQFYARMSQNEKEDCDKMKAEIKLLSLPTKITDGEIVKKALNMMLQSIKKGEA